MRECTKAVIRRLSAPNFATRYFRGNGIDIGGAPDPLTLYASLFPLIESIKIWDRPDGDARYMPGVPDDTFDFVHSSHCLEHLDDAAQGLTNWFRILKPGGHLLVTVPDEDLYEQGVFPSTFNRDHKWTFTICKSASWSARSLNVVDLVRNLGESAQVVKIELIDLTYRYDLPRYDQTLTPIAESCIEIIVRKRFAEELNFRGAPPRSAQPSPTVRVHLNQYRDDMATLKSANKSRPPFQNDQQL
jgi:SAM-dependent methyltransferase